MAGDATGSVMRAGDVGRAARRDLQFRIPRKPVVRLGLRARPEETGWIIDGARKSQVLGGAFAREHMGALLQACDGTRTLDEIGEVTGVGPQDPAAQSTDDVAPIGGRVWTIDLVSGITTCSPTVAVDRCETCSGRYEGRRDGLPALAALLPERREEVA